jgi:hypothetical protein
MKKEVAFILIVFIFFQGCYSYRVVVPNSTPVADSESTTVNSLFWGLLNDPQQIIAEECRRSNSIHEVKFSTNLGYSLISIVTLGIWMPVNVEWKCGPQQTGTENPL